MTAVSPKPARVYFFGTCLADALYPEAGIAAIRLIEHEGVRVVFPPRSPAAAQPAYNSGYPEEARLVARHQIRTFRDDIPIVVPSGSCAGMMKYHYPVLFAGDPDLPAAQEFAARVVEWYEFMTRLGAAYEDRGSPIRVTWHSSCHALREMRVIEHSKALIRSLGQRRAGRTRPGERVLRVRRHVLDQAARHLGRDGRRQGGRHRRDGRGSGPHGRLRLSHEHHGGGRPARAAASKASIWRNSSGSASMGEGFQKNAERALDDAQLRRNFAFAMGNFILKRKAVFSDPVESERLRTAAAIERRALARLPELLEQLEASCTENGIQVHWAETSEDANRDRARASSRRHGATRVVKGKSMVSEEMHLNAFLGEPRASRSLETDLGEYIIQLDGETPSHIIIPAIHKNKDQIARHVRREDPRTRRTPRTWIELTAIARRTLRREVPRGGDRAQRRELRGRRNRHALPGGERRQRPHVHARAAGAHRRHGDGEGRGAPRGRAAAAAPARPGPRPASSSRPTST